MQSITRSIENQENIFMVLQVPRTHKTPFCTQTHMYKRWINAHIILYTFTNTHHTNILGVHSS